MEAASLEGGFGNVPLESSIAFRAVMDAMARPGIIGSVSGARPPQPLSIAAGTVLLTLADATTPVYLAAGFDGDPVRDWLRFHTGAPIVGRAEAVFAIGDWQALLPLEAYRIGTPEYPDRSATLIVEMPVLEAEGARLSGPGIKEIHNLGLPDIAAFRRNALLFPLGLDFIFTSGDRVAALPRTTKVEAAPCM